MRLRVAYLLLALAVACAEKPEDKPGVETIPGVPQNVKLHAATETSLTFQWSAVDGATGYGWKLSLDGAEISGVVSSRNVVVENLRPGTTYGFCVCAKGAAGSSDYSAVIEAKTEGTPPDPSALKVCSDAPVVLEFDSTPVLGTSGTIRVFRDNGTKVDEIDLADLSKVNVLDDGTMVPKEQIVGEGVSHTFMDVISCGGKTRKIHYTPLRIQGKKLLVKLHSGVLEHGCNYYVTMDAGVVTGFPGIKEGELQFTTKDAPASDKALRVSADGTGDFCTVQGALSYANKTGCEITVASGTYREMLYLRDKASIAIKGDSRDGTVIAYPNSEVYANGSSARCLFLVENCDNLALKDLTIENTFYASDHKGQAETIYFNSGSNAHKLTIEGCKLVSWQDTFLTKGEVWVYKTIIAGHCDFIWGYPKACLFEECELRVRAAGYIVQARVPGESYPGFVFLNCNIVKDGNVSDGSVYLARSGGDTSVYDNVVYVNCTMDSIIAPEGWHTGKAPTPSTPTATSGWREYGSVKPDGSSASGSRNAYGKVLTAAEAEPYSSRQAVLGW
ncbi:MAG: fibronectin type III domain-containing protein [Bacteroidales bacterium]|nr:fibronectin type III domain-containing protein [Bacteroidales bacterium]